MANNNKLSDLLGTTEQNYKLDGSNKIDFFPAIIANPTEGTPPDDGSVTVLGVAIPALLFATGEANGIKVELNHNYKDNGYLDIHLRAFATNTNNGNVVFTYNFIILGDPSETVKQARAGDTITLTGTVATGDLAAGRYLYLSGTIDAVALNIKAGEMLSGIFTRSATGNTYTGDVAVEEIGFHGAIDSTGDTLGV
jgi:hypothetical protein